MCGFNGVFSLNNNLLTGSDKSLVNDMNNIIKHRGPDYDETRKISDSCVLGHVRLSIIDVSSASNQPMTSSCGRYHIVFNGEIYNYQEIRNKYNLETKSTGDTEVLLEAIAKKGLSVVDEFNGIFAFALFNNQDSSLVIARDRFGVKPAYFSANKDKLYFSSEIKALTALEEIDKCFNENCLSDFLSFLCLPEDKTFFKGIYKVRPGEMISFSSDGSKKSTIYAEPVNDRKFLEQEISPHYLSNEFTDTVVRQSVSDVPLGIFLSGGVDSNGILNSLIKNNISPTAYTASFESDHDSYSSETMRVKEVVKKYDINFREVKITRDLFWAKLDNVIYHQDEPLADPVSIPVYFLSKDVSKNNEKVIHVGEGADELFFGYEAWRNLERLQYLQYPQKFFFKYKFIRFLKLFSFLKIILPTRYAEALRRFIEGLPLFWGGTDALTYAEKLEVGVDKNDLINTDKFIRNTYTNFTRNFKDNSPNKWMTYFDLKLRLPELMLMRVDKMAMASGVEARVPFLDNHLSDISWNIPIKQKRNTKSMKVILKKSFHNEIDDDILYAKKQGFNAPAEEWCIEESDKIYKEIKDFCHNTGKLNYDGISSLCKKKPRHLWRFYVLARWYKLNFDN